MARCSMRRASTPGRCPAAFCATPTTTPTTRKRSRRDCFALLAMTEFPVIARSAAARRSNLEREAENGRNLRLRLHASAGDAAPGRGLDRHDADLARRPGHADGDERPVALAGS